jgi:hypothetical protein
MSPATDVLPVPALELLDELADHAVVEVLPTQMGVAGGGLDLDDDALLDGHQRHVKGATSEVEDERVLLVATLLPAFVSSAQAMAAAVGSLRTRITLRPEMAAASLVACRWESLKQAETVTTAFLTVEPMWASAIPSSQSAPLR